MQAITFDRYGPPDVLRLEAVETPPVTEDGVLVRVRAASLNPYDWHFMTGKPYIMRLMLGGLRKPVIRRLGADLAGEVEAVGDGVAGIRPGDAVYGMVNDVAAGKELLALGALAEYVCVREENLAPKPERLTFEQAAAVPIAALTALKGLRDLGRLQPGQHVLINGASGGVGTFAVQIAKALGASVTGVCSGRNEELVRSLGADRVIDYTREDFTKAGERCDLLLDLVGNHSLRACARALKPGGVCLMSFGRPERAWLGPFPELLGAGLMKRFVKVRPMELNWRRERDDLPALNELLESGKVTPVVDRSFPLSDAPEAMRYLERWHARGKVIVTT